MLVVNEGCLAGDDFFAGLFIFPFTGRKILTFIPCYILVITNFKTFNKSPTHWKQVPMNEI